MNKEGCFDGCLKIVGIVAAVAAIAIFGMVYLLTVKHEAKEALNKVEISKYSMAKRSTDMALRVDITLYNGSERAAKDIDIACAEIASSGTVIDNNAATIYQRIEPKSYLTVRDFEMGLVRTQTKTVRCRVAGSVAD